MLDFKIYGIIGKPVLHSLSPAMMNAAFTELQINAKYLQIPVNSAEEAIDIMERVGISGINVTAPFKEDIISFAEILSDKVKQIGSANTILKEGDKISAFNTDYEGVKQSIQNLEITGKKALVLGTGGAAKTVVQVLMDLQFEVILLGRNQKKLKEFQNKFNCQIEDIENIKENLSEVELIISTLPNATEYLKAEFLRKDHIIFDANYKNDSLKKLSESLSFQYIKGTQWLLNQAKPAFELFTNKTIDISVLEKGILNSVNKNCSVISLIGFMGVGKTTVGKYLAKILSCKFIDLDDLIEKRYNTSIPEIFENIGEEAFRRTEHKILAEVLKMKRLILSCGGGIIKRKENRDLLDQNTKCFWLDASVNYCLDGLDISNRPLLQVENPVVAAEQIYAERKMYYAQTAHVLINAENKTTEQISNQIYDEIIQSNIL